MIINGVKYKTGDSISCVIDELVISDSKIFVDEEYNSHEYKTTTFRFFICQNKLEGAPAPDLLGYKGSWVMYYYIEEDGNYFRDVIKLKNLSSNIFDSVLELAFPIKG